MVGSDLMVQCRRSRGRVTMKTASGEREALYAAVCESPDDDAPRLVFADWLEEHGQEAWAALIRAQVGAARLPRWDPEHIRLQRVAHSVYTGAMHKEAGRGIPEEIGWSFERGFPGVVRERVETFLGYADA